MLFPDHILHLMILRSVGGILYEANYIVHPLSHLYLSSLPPLTCQVAILCGHHSIAADINSFRPDEVGKLVFLTGPYLTVYTGSLYMYMYMCRILHGCNKKMFINCE